MSIMLRKRLVKKNEKKYQREARPRDDHRHCRPGEGQQRERAVAKVDVAALAVFSLRTDEEEAAPVGVPPEGDEPTGHEDESQ